MLITIVIIYVCVYSIINRICSCIEHCKAAKAYEKLQEFVSMNTKTDEAKEDEN